MEEEEEKKKAREILEWGNKGKALREKVIKEKIKKQIESKNKFTEEEIRKAKKKISKSISFVGHRGFLTKEQVKSLQKKLERT